MAKNRTKNDCQRARHRRASLTLSGATSYAGWHRCVLKELELNESEQESYRLLISMPCRIAKQTVKHILAKAILLATELTIYFNYALFR